MKAWNSSYVVRAKHKLHNSGQQQKGGIRKVLASSRQGKDTSARGLGVMRDPTKAIMGREQTCEPVVKETLPSRVTWNPRNKQIVSNTAKALGSAEVLKQFVVAKTCGEQGRSRAKSLLVLLGHTCVALSQTNNASVWLHVCVSQGTDALDHVRSEFNEI